MKIIKLKLVMIRALLILLFCFKMSMGQVGIGTENPDESAILDIKSKEKGLLIPRMTTQEIELINKPANGLLIYNTSNQSICINIGKGGSKDWHCLTILQKQLSSSGGGSSSTTKSTEPMMITEYVEGSSNNKYIELYNNSNSTVDLSSYTLAKDSNGNGNYSIKGALSGTLASKTTIVYANSEAVKYTGTVNKNLGNVTTFNGNDQVVLMKGNTIIDHVGTSGSSYWGKDKGLRRKTTINKPNATYTASEWTVITTTDDVSGLGSR